MSNIRNELAGTTSLAPVSAKTARSPFDEYLRGYSPEHYINEHYLFANADKLQRCSGQDCKNVIPLGNALCCVVTLLPTEEEEDPKKELRVCCSPKCLLQFIPEAGKA